MVDFFEVRMRQVAQKCEVEAPVCYTGEPVGVGRVDVLVANRLVVELKAVETLNVIHRDQVVAYVQALHLELGLLINFNVLRLRQGIKRIVNTYQH
jgi:GxxExxY protein